MLSLKRKLLIFLITITGFFCQQTFAMHSDLALDDLWTNFEKIFRKYISPLIGQNSEHIKTAIDEIYLHRFSENKEKKELLDWQEADLQAVALFAKSREAEEVILKSEQIDDDLELLLVGIESIDNQNILSFTINDAHKAFISLGNMLKSASILIEEDYPELPENFQCCLPLVARIDLVAHIGKIAEEIYSLAETLKLDDNKETELLIIEYNHERRMMSLEKDYENALKEILVQYAKKLEEANNCIAEYSEKLEQLDKERKEFEQQKSRSPSMPIKIREGIITKPEQPIQRSQSLSLKYDSGTRGESLGGKKNIIIKPRGKK